MLPVKCRERAVGQLTEDWAARVYRYGVLEMAQTLNIPPTTLYNKLNGRSSFFDDEVKAINKALALAFKKESAMVNKTAQAAK